MDSSIEITKEGIRIPVNIYPDSVDPDLFPTYEGGNPARFCNPNQKNYAGEGIKMNKIGYTYDGHELIQEDSGYIEGLLYQIDQRKKNYGKKRESLNWDSFKKK